MEKAFVKMLKDFGKNKKDEVYEIDSETAKSWIEAGLAEETNPQGDLVSKFSKALEERDNALIKAISDSVKVESKTPSVRVKTDEADKTKSFGQFCQMVWKATSTEVDPEVKAEARKQLNAVYKTTLQVSDGVHGGYLVPETFIPSLIEIPEYPSVFRGRATSVPVSGEGALRLPALDHSVTPDGNGQTSWNAGVNVFWANELDEAQETNPKFRDIELNPNRMTAFIPVSNSLLRSSPLGVEAIIRRLFNRQTIAKLEYGYLLGDGVGKPLGMLDTNNGIVQSVSRGTPNEINYVDVCKMWQELPASSQGSAVWLVGQKAIAQLLQMEDGAGNAVFHPSAQAGVDMRLFNRPILVSEFLPAAGTAKDLCLLDPSLYYNAESLQPTISVSEHVRFLKDQVVFRMELYADGQPALNYKPKLGDGSATVSPAIYLS